MIVMYMRRVTLSDLPPYSIASYANEALTLQNTVTSLYSFWFSPPRQFANYITFVTACHLRELTLHFSHQSGSCPLIAPSPKTLSLQIGMLSFLLYRFVGYVVFSCSFPVFRDFHRSVSLSNRLNYQILTLARNI